MTTKAARSSIEPLYRCAFTPDDLRAHPPVFTLAHKKVAYAKHCPDGPQRGGRVEVSRWPTAPPQAGAAAAAATVVAPVAGGFGYEPMYPGAVEWWGNFAATDLFAH